MPLAKLLATLAMIAAVSTGIAACSSTPEAAPPPASSKASDPPLSEPADPA